jgi:membrane fusion protein (multidrug efflux system)
MINTRVEKADVEAARAKVVQVEKSIEGTKVLIAETYIRSPLDGLVAAKQMEAGEMVKQDSIIMTLITVSKVFVSLNVNEGVAQSVRTGQKVTFTADALGSTPFTGTVDRIVPLLDSKTRTLEIKALVNNPGIKLLPGMFVRAKIISGILKNAITVPLTSLLKREGASGELYLVRKISRSGSR